MDEKLKTDEKQVMLVRKAKDGSLKAVSDVDNNGNIKTTEPTQENMSKLLDVNTQESFLEAFFKKFLQEVQNPTHSGIYILTENALKKLFKIDLDAEILENYRVNPTEALEYQQESPAEFQPMDISEIDRTDLEKKGIKWEDLEPHLKAMSYGHKSHGLVEMNFNMDGVRLSTKGRLKLEEQPDASLRVIPYYWKNQPDVDSPFHNMLLDDESKSNLLNTGNAGKVIDLELTPGKPEPCYVSIDKYTNDLEALPVREMDNISQIKSTVLSGGQQLDFMDGRKVLAEGMTSRKGYLFDAYIQINASDRKIDFTYEGINRNRYAFENKEIRREMRQESQEGGTGKAQENSQTQINIPNKILGARVPKEAFDQWTDAVGDPAKQKAVQAFYIKDMMKKGQSEPFNAWVKPNFERGKMDFFKWNPNMDFQTLSAERVKRKFCLIY